MVFLVKLKKSFSLENRLDVTSEGLRPCEQYARELQQDKHGSIEIGDAVLHEYRGKDKQLAYKQRSKCVNNCGYGGAVACATQQYDMQASPA